jgi:subtilisin family serine protease
MEKPQKQDFLIHLISRKPFDPRKEPLSPPPVEAAWYIVQFVKPLTFDEQKRLRARYGLRLADYMPNLAFLEWLEPGTWHALAKDKLHHASVLYEASDKISPRIDKLSVSDKRPALRLCAVLFPTANPDDFLKELKALLPSTSPRDSSKGVKHAPGSLSKKGKGIGPDVDRHANERIKVFDDRSRGGNLQVIFPAPPQETLLQIAKLKEVRWIEEEAEINLDSSAPLERTPGGLIQSGRVGHTTVWDKEITGRGQVIGVTDQPINPSHCMFKDSNPTIGPEHRKLRGHRQGTFREERLHGQRVAALAAGHNRDDTLNISRGMAWEAKLSLDDVGRIKDETLNIFQALTNQCADGAFIHSNSWHKELGYDEKAADVDRFVRANEKHFVCGSSGNSGEYMGAPGSAKNALCVSASKNDPNELEFVDGVIGPIGGYDTRRKPEICAPGGDIKTAGKGPCRHQDIGYASSWATPIIAGAAALVRQYYLEGWYPTGTKREEDSLDPSGALVKATLLNSTVDMSPSGYPSNREGWGLVRLTNTLFFEDASTPQLFVRDIPNALGLHTCESHTYCLDIMDDSQPLKITLVWSDEAATLPAGPPLVNDLNLTVTSPDGKIFLGNHFDENGLSTEGGEADNTNNVEMVICNQELQGTWSINVHCAAANGETKIQGYALVATAALF